MEDRLLVAKTVLECYAHLDDLYDALTESSSCCVRNGFYAIFPSEQMRLYERIAKYEDRKAGLYNMKYLIEEAFRRGGSVSMSFLRERYVEGVPMEVLTERYGVCKRTCYRYMQRGLAEFALEAERLGYDKKRFICEYGDEPLFTSMLNRVIREDDGEEAREAEETTSINSRRIRPRPNNTDPDRYCA